MIFWTKLNVLTKIILTCTKYLNDTYIQFAICIKNGKNRFIMEDIVIVGSGGFAREVYWIIRECNRENKIWNVLGWVSNEQPGTVISGLPVLGDDSWLINYEETINAVICVGDGNLRKKLYDKYKNNPNIIYPNIIAPNVSMSDSVVMGKGCIVASMNVFTVDITIGDFLICNLSSTIGHDCVIGDFVTIFPGAHVSGNVCLEDGCSLGTGVSVIQGIEIGKNSFIGAGATVINSIPDNCTAVGIPAKPMGHK